MDPLTTLRLDCGMPLIVEAIPGVRSVGIAWYVPAGSATDPDERQGLSAMWSELLFRGAGALDSRAQADALDRLGITRGADVGTFFLNLGFTLTGERLLHALPLIVDMLRRPRMDPDSIEPVRDLSLQALQSLADDPHERCALAARERHNPAPLNRSGLGTEAGLRAITRGDLLEGWQRRARPGGAIFAVAGDVGDAGGAAGIARELNRLLAGWEGSAPEPGPGDAPHKGTYHHIDDNSSQVQILAVHDAPPEPHPDSTAERIVSSVLSGGMSARLFTEVREKRGLCYSVSESYAADRDYGRCVAYVGTTPERAQQSLDVLLAELQRINGDGSAAGGVTEEEFDVALVGIKSRIVFSGESTSARAQTLVSDFHKRGRARSLDEIAAAYDALTLDQVNAYLARRRLGPTTIVTLGPKALTPPRTPPGEGRIGG
jgi:predicted Zn-dependent peptidase